MCNPITGGLGCLVSTATENSFQQFAQDVTEALGKAIASLGTLWTAVPSPNVSSGAGATVASASTAPGAAGFVTILAWVQWVSLGLCVLSLIAAGVMFMIPWVRSRVGEHFNRIGFILAAVILITAATTIVAALFPHGGHTGGNPTVAFLQNSLWWYTAGLAVLSIIVGAARMAWTQRGAVGKEVLQSILTLLLVQTLGVIGVGILTAAGDGFSNWVLQNATGLTFGQNMSVMLGLTASSPIGVIAVCLLGTIAMLMSDIQLVLMLLRGAMLVLLTGIWPLAASFSNLETGRNWFRRCTGWLLAFILYKPAAALVYAAAFRLIGQDPIVDPSGLLPLLEGLALMGMALIALPALMRFMVPVVGSIGASAGGVALTGGAAVMGGEMASGAIRSAMSKSNGAASGGSAGGDESSSTGSAAPSTGGAGGGDAAASTGASEASAAAGEGAAASTGAASGGAAAGGGAAAASGAAAAAGPAAIAVIAAQKVGEVGKAAGDTAGAAASDVTGS